MDVNCVANRLISLGLCRQEHNAIIASFSDIRRAIKCLRRVVDGVDYVRDTAERKRKILEIRDYARRIRNIPRCLVHRRLDKPVVQLYAVANDSRRLRRKALVRDSRIFCRNPSFRADRLGKSVFVYKTSKGGMAVKLRFAQPHFSGRCRIIKILAVFRLRVLRVDKSAIYVKLKPLGRRHECEGIVEPASSRRKRDGDGMIHYARRSHGNIQRICRTDRHEIPLAEQVLGAPRIGRRIDPALYGKARGKFRVRQIAPATNV